MKFLALIAILGFSVQMAAAAVAPSDKVDCSKIDEVLDDLGGAQGITTMNDKYKLSTTEEDYIRRCAEVTEAIKSLRKYNKECFTALTQQVFSAILRTRSAIVEARCKPGSAEAKESVEAMKCIQENALENVRQAERKTIIGAQVIVEENIPDEKMRTRRACCAVQDSKNLFLGAIKEKCSKFEKVYTEYVESYTSEAMCLICPEADKLDCDKLEKVKVDGVEPKSTFFLNPTIKLVKTLDH